MTHHPNDREPTYAEQQADSEQYNEYWRDRDEQDGNEQHMWD